MSILALWQALFGDIPGTVFPAAVDFNGNYLEKTDGSIVSSPSFFLAFWIYHTGQPGDVYSSTHQYWTNPLQIRVQSERSVAFSARNSGLVYNVVWHIPAWTWMPVLWRVSLGGGELMVGEDIVARGGYSEYPNITGSLTSRLGDFTGRLAHFFVGGLSLGNLDNVSDVRKFVTPDTKPADIATQIHSGEIQTPYRYHPLTDPSTAHIDYMNNDLVQAGMFSLSAWGPNQWNCVMARFNGTDNFLARDGLSGVSDSTSLSMAVVVAGGSGPDSIMYFSDASGENRIEVSTSVSGRFKKLVIICTSSSSAQTVQRIDTEYVIPLNTIYSVQLAIDNTSISKTKVLINYKDVAFINPPDSVGAAFPLSAFTDCKIGGQGIGSPSSVMDGAIGEFWLNSTGPALDAFWDSETDTPKPVRQVMAETGIQPAVAMPLRADKPGQNYGTAGDFIRNGYELVGARSISEHWARSVEVTDSSPVKKMHYLSADLPSRPAGPYALVAFVRRSQTHGSILGTAGGHSLELVDNTGIRVAHSSAVYSTAPDALPDTLAFLPVFLWHDGDTGHAHINGTHFFQAGEGYSGGQYAIFNSLNANAYDFPGSIGPVFFAVEAIDFLQEMNRLKFVDALGYPRDLAAAISSGEIPRPLFHLEFKDPDNPGRDSSRNNNHFQVHGIMTPGPDVNP